MEDFLYQFFVNPFVSLGSGLAEAGSGSASWIEDVVSTLDGFVWGPVMILLLLGTHVFMTFRTRFIQRKLIKGIKLSVSKDEGSGDVSPFQALTTSLAATIGTGNIIGVATALIAGGPGALLWMWLTGVFGIATKYSETLIAVKYRVKDHNGNMLGGAMYALQRGFKKKKLGKVLAVLFALFAAIASFGIGAAVQANSLSEAIVSVAGDVSIATDTFSVFGLFETSLLQVIVGLLVVLFVAIVILGGIKSISRVCEKLIPFMTIFYVVSCLILIIMNAPFLGEALVLIATCAFTPQAAFGGAVGTSVMIALQMGCARGLFSNESGLGSSPLVASAAVTRNPARQALISMTGTFWDTVIVCALTGLALVSSILANPEIAVTFVDGGFVGASAALVTTVFAQIPVVGPFVLCVGLVLFAYSTMLGWSYYGNRCITYLFGKNAIRPYQIVFIFICFLGAIGVSGFVWDISDMTNALIAIPNLIAVLGLSALIARETKHYVYDDNLDEIDETPIPIEETK